MDVDVESSSDESRDSHSRCRRRLFTLPGHASDSDADSDGSRDSMFSDIPAGFFEKQELVMDIVQCHLEAHRKADEPFTDVLERVRGTPSECFEIGTPSDEDAGDGDGNVGGDGAVGGDGEELYACTTTQSLPQVQGK